MKKWQFNISVIFFFLIWAACLLPIGFEYTLSFFLLAIGTLVFKWKPSYAGVHEIWLSNMDKAILCWSGLTVLSAIIAYFLNGETQIPVGKIVVSSCNLVFKTVIWWVILSRIILTYLAPAQQNDRWIKALGVYVSLYFAYLLGQRYFGWDFVHGFGARLGQHRFDFGVYRLSGFMGHPLTLAHNWGLLTVFCAIRALHENAVQRRRWFMYIVFISVVALLMSGSRAPALATMLALGILFAPFMLRKLKILFSAIVVLLAFLWWEGLLVARVLSLFTNMNQQWTNGRFLYWRTHWQMFLDHPFFGVGFFAKHKVSKMYYESLGVTDKAQQMSAHNFFIQTLADSGLVGLVGVGFLFYSIFHVLADNGSRLFAAAVLVFLLSTGMLQNHLHDSEFIYALFVMIPMYQLWSKNRQ